MEKNMTFKQGEEKREELELPTLHFVVMDQWIDVIGEKALFSWLKMYTWCDRDRAKGDKPVDLNLWEQSKIPSSFKEIMKKLGVGKDTFYNKILKPLWNVGLIDIEEWAEDPRSGQKAMNVIVYKYPQNKKELSFKPIIEVRNYDTDYSSSAKGFAKSGGRPRKEEIPTFIDKKTPSKDPQMGGGSQIERGGFSNRTGGGSQIGDSNILNTPYNSLNTPSNNLNSKSITLSSSSSLETNNVIKNEEEEEKNYIMKSQNYAYMILSDFLKEAGIDRSTVNKTIAELNNFEVDLFLMEDVKDQLEHMIEKKQSGGRIYDFAKYFAKGLKDLTLQTNVSRQHQEQKLQEYEANSKNVKKVEFYNWLEERN